MIVIIDYGSKDTNILADMFRGLNVEVKVCRIEGDICKAQKIVLPHISDVGLALKKINFCNIYSLLRLIKKPVLGIGSGTELMFLHSGDKQLPGFGFIPVDITSRSVNLSRAGVHRVRPVNDNLLFKNVPDQFCMFDYPLEVPATEYTAAFMDDDESRSAALEYKNYFGVLFSPEKSGPAGMKIIENFSTLETQSSDAFCSTEDHVH